MGRLKEIIEWASGKKREKVKSGAGVIPRETELRVDTRGLLTSTPHLSLFVSQLLLTLHLFSFFSLFCTFKLSGCFLSMCVGSDLWSSMVVGSLD